MILYAIKYQEKYLRDKGAEGIILTKLDRASVYSERKEAEELAVRFGKKTISLIKLTLQEEEIAR